MYMCVDIYFCKKKVTLSIVQFFPFALVVLYSLVRAEAVHGFGARNGGSCPGAACPDRAGTDPEALAGKSQGGRAPGDPGVRWQAIGLHWGHHRSQSIGTVAEPKP